MGATVPFRPSSLHPPSSDAMAELTQADRYLLDQIRRGDGEGWSALVARYQGRLLAFARRG